jgi:hypothetical protein
MKIGGIEIHPSITIDVVVAAVERHNSSLDNPGFCIACGEEAFDCEPDARRNPCEVCEQLTVYGAEELLIYMAA